MQLLVKTRNFPNGQGMDESRQDHVQQVTCVCHAYHSFHVRSCSDVIGCDVCLGITLRPTLISATQSYYTIRPTVTGSVCDTAARSLNTATCDFVLQVFAKNPMVDTPIDFK